MRHRDLQLFSDPYQIGQRCRRHLLHDFPAVDLKCLLAVSVFCRCLLVEKPANHQCQNLAFAWRQLEIAAIEIAQIGPLRTDASVQRDRSADRLHQVLVAKGLRQEIHRAMLDGPNGRWDVAVASDKHDRRMISTCDLVLQIKAVDIWKLHIQDEAGRPFWLLSSDIGPGGSESYS